MFHDRREAGRQLAAEIVRRNYPDPVVLALPRGGVPVAFEVAKALRAPLDLVMVRKLGVPFNPEVAAGAVVDGAAPDIVLNEDVVRRAGMTIDDIRAIAAKELETIRRRRALYLGGRAPVSVQGKTAIVVDDGVATGATAMAALRAVRDNGAKRVVLAAPVAPPDVVHRLAGLADEVVVLSMPDPFYAVGAHYRVFDQTADEEVIRLLDEARQWTGEEGRESAEG